MNIKKILVQVATSLLGIEGYEKVKYSLFRHFSRSSGYTVQYYTEHAKNNKSCYPVFANGVYGLFQPSSIVDIGCGAGLISLEFLKLGVQKIHAFDYSSDAVRLAKQNGILDAAQLDLTQNPSISARGDLCICLEVLEHIPEKHAHEAVRFLCSTAPILVVSAATPGQIGFLHVNLKPRQYWINLFSEKGFEYDDLSLSKLLEHFGGRVIKDYSDNLMIFRSMK